MHKLEFFFDCSSPWTFLAFESLQQMLTRHPDLEVQYRPFLVGGVFNTVNPSVYASRENPVIPKQRYGKKDLQDWADYVGIKIIPASDLSVFPVNSVKAMRGAFVAIEEECLVPYARRVFERYWSEGADISQEEELNGIIAHVGLDKFDFYDKINDQKYKDMLKDNTTEVIERGGFGTPTMFLDGTDMYFGNDRFQLIEAKLK
ncbi:2-hydroxychromene-2-carboxylate isomerase [Sneathiella sp. CAU 1612]|jgi:2-hydroxychromene-2-carboxylate isomerase|uniref:2-hydroxychromene-2-carboxylate isomerase n=1 Tax=Sneathiella sedimenti TaxID=2816034 RepID=A0ABS3F8B6_9PROT|nr:2-hydroxychromene-2-carboxylate isomerase [Sneathiella sedimenti]MBO0334750.1 2-hydroxychromene-2-carboxylate isomerase [Sneathiella sedimenti]